MNNYPGIYQSSFDVEQNEGVFKYTPDNDRLGFIKKVYGILSMQLFITVVFTALVISDEYLTLSVQSSPGLMYLTSFGSLGIIISLFCCTENARRVPLNYVLLLSFTLCESYMVAFICSVYETSTVLLAAMMTLGVTLALTAYACYTTTEFNSFRGAGVVMLSILILFGIFGISRLGGFADLLFCCLGVAVYGFYIIYDTQLIADGDKYGLSLDDYILGAMMLYVDIIGLFIYLLRLLAKKDN